MSINNNCDYYFWRIKQFFINSSDYVSIAKLCFLINIILKYKVLENFIQFIFSSSNKSLKIACKILKSFKLGNSITFLPMHTTK